MAERKDPLALEAQLCFALYSASLAMTQVYKPLLEPLGLTYTQYLVLLVLWKKNGIGLKEVADQLQQKPGALTPVIKRMEKEGFVRRIRSKEDERYMEITLTELGLRLKKDAKKINQCIFESCGMKENDLETMREELKALREKLRNFSG